MRSTIPRLGAALATFAIVLAACGGGTTSPSGSGAAASQGTGEVVEIRWFCCLGAGDNAETQVPTEERVVEEFNASHDDIELVLEVVDYDSAFDAMSVQIAGGNAPDIVGPVGVSGAEAFHGQWLDLTDVIASSGHDLTQYTEGSVDFYRSDEFGQEGLPFAIYPSMTYYHRDMFDEAGLEYPPHTFGDPYVLDGDEVEWNFDTLREVAKRLTVDVNGNDASEADFDPTQIDQYGYEPVFQDLRAIGSYFGAGSLVADDGETAQIPDPWQDAWAWHYDNIWEHHITMTEALRDAPEFGNENPFQARKAAMAISHLWYTCCTSPVDDAGDPIDPQWDIAAVPSNNGTITSNFNADTFRIWGDTEHPEEAFEVLTYLIGDAAQDLLGIYGGMPARTADQEPFFAGLEERWTQGVDWQVAKDSVAYADNPSFEGWTPNYQAAFAAVVAFESVLRSTEGLDLAAEIEGLREELQTIYDRPED
ncbi:MAG TPA: extracellular solute-binding protein [Candidatus Limnocylindria bacterium]|nr:extracellular solute-binding protein [Candidatus Limnocylindria bacterium]